MCTKSRSCIGRSRRVLTGGYWLLLFVIMHGTACGHEPSRVPSQRAVEQTQARADAVAETVETTAADAQTCQLTINLVDDFADQSMAGLVRVTNLDTGKAIKLEEGFHRGLNWYSLAAKATVRLPCARVRVEAIQGLETTKVERDLDLRETETATTKLTLEKFYDTQLRQVFSGNTHLHLMKMSRAEAERYLGVVSQSDRLDLVFLSHLRRVPDERDYISNEIVEDSFEGDALEQLSQDGVLFAGGQEHRHNFGRGGQGYGHAMFLNLQKLIRPVSIGPGIMGDGTDGRPLQESIRQARDAQATVIWCHNALGFESVPNWVGGLIHAQNIFDGGSVGSYEDTFYRYLDLGMHVPFSTGTDWNIYDFSRVYIPVFGDLTAGQWLEGLRRGKSYITNGPFLELETERAELGDTISMPGPNFVTVVGRGMGRLDFGGLELVHNGRVVSRVKTTSEGGAFYADLRHALQVDQPGWFALRIPKDAGKNELDRPLFAHTSPIYIELAGRNIFRPDVARDLVREMQESIKAVDEKAVFADEAERQRVLDVYRAAVQELEDRIQKAENGNLSP